MVTSHHSVHEDHLVADSGKDKLKWLSNDVQERRDQDGEQNTSNLYRVLLGRVVSCRWRRETLEE